MLNKQKCLIIILLLVIAVSCKKSSQPRFGRHYVPRGLKDYFNWQVGSYWIFKDSLGGVIDSVFVSDYTQTTWGPGLWEPRDTNEVIHIRLRERPDVFYPTFAFDISSGDGNCYVNEDYWAGNGYHFIEGWPFNLTGSDSVQKTIIPSIVVSGKTYTNVYKYRRIVGTGAVHEIYLNADSGLIKLAPPELQGAFLLQRSHIVH